MGHDFGVENLECDTVRLVRALSAQRLIVHRLVGESDALPVRHDRPLIYRKEQHGVLVRPLLELRKSTGGDTESGGDVTHVGLPRADTAGHQEPVSSVPHSSQPEGRRKARRVGFEQFGISRKAAGRKHDPFADSNVGRDFVDVQQGTDDRCVVRDKSSHGSLCDVPDLLISPDTIVQRRHCGALARSMNARHGSGSGRCPERELDAVTS